MSVRTYNPSVRVGNWNEDIQLEEDTLKDFLEKRERGELLIQKTAALKNVALDKVDLSVSRDGRVHFGDTVIVVNPEPKDQSRRATALSIHAQGVSATSKVEPCARTALVITSKDGSPPGRSLKYGQAFYLCSGDLFLHSDRSTFQTSAKKSRHNAVSFVSEPSHLTEWNILSFDPQYRMELEHSEVPANQKLIIAHVKTNQALCLEAAHTLRTPFGHEYEVSAFTSLDSHKAEQNCNHWMLTMKVPGDTTMSVESPN